MVLSTVHSSHEAERKSPQIDPSRLNINLQCSHRGQRSKDGSRTVLHLKVIWSRHVGVKATRGNSIWISAELSNLTWYNGGWEEKKKQNVLLLVNIHNTKRPILHLTLVYNIFTCETSWCHRSKRIKLKNGNKSSQNETSVRSYLQRHSLFLSSVQERFILNTNVCFYLFLGFFNF